MKNALRQTISYRPDIDGLRALAVISVVLFHAFPKLFPGGFIGVDIFFVISGYLITSILVHDVANNSFRFVNFYSRRIRRIFTALLVVLFSTVFLAIFFTPI
jgi:peptidoglycan/LPS O-acetylase OafA/YrhL